MLQGIDRRILDGVEDAGIRIFLDLADGCNQVGIPAGHADPPAGHVVGFGQRVQLYADLFRPVGHQKTQFFLSGEDHFTVGIIITNGDIVLFGKGNHTIEKFPGGAGPGGIVGIVQKHPTRPFHDLRRNVFKDRQIAIFPPDRHIVRFAAAHQDAGPIGGIAGIGHQNHITGVDPGEDKVMTALFGTDQSQDLVFGIQRNPVTGMIPERHLLAEPEHPFFLVGRVTVILRIFSPTGEFPNNSVRGGFYGITNSQADDIYAVSPGFGDFFSQFHEQVWGNFSQTIGCLHTSSPLYCYILFH